MFTKEPMCEMTTPNSSGRNHAIENAAMPPDEPPAATRWDGSRVSSTPGSYTRASVGAGQSTNEVVGSVEGRYVLDDG